MPSKHIDEKRSHSPPESILRRAGLICFLALVLSSAQFMLPDHLWAEPLTSPSEHHTGDKPRGEPVMASQSTTAGTESASSNPDSPSSQRWYPKLSVGTGVVWADGIADPLFPGFSASIGAGMQSRGQVQDLRDLRPIHGFEVNLHHTRHGLTGDYDGQTVSLSGLTADGRLQPAFGPFEPAALVGLGLQFLSWDGVDAPAMGVSYRAGLGADIRQGDIAFGVQFILNGYQVISATLPGTSPPEWMGDSDVIWNGAVTGHIKWYL